MPKQYEKCVASYTKKGMSEARAKSICAAAYYKQHGMTVKQAHQRGIEEEDLIAMLESADGTREKKHGVLLEVPLESSFTIEEGEDGAYKFEGTALIDGVMSSNKRYYSQEFNDRALAMTKQYVENGGTVTIFSRHGQAVGSWLTGLPKGLPIGQVPDLWREAGKIRYRGEIYPTREGRDAIMLLQKGVMRQTSVRALWYRSRLVKDGDTGDVHEEMVDAIIQGIDLAEEAGIEGAGIDKVFEEAPHWVALEEAETMSDLLKGLTLDELKEGRADLFEEIAASVKAGLEEQGWGPAQDPEVDPEDHKNLQEERDSLKGEKETLETQVAEGSLRIAILEASQMGASGPLAEALTEAVESADEIDEKLPTVKEEVLKEYLSSIGVEEAGSAEGRQRMENEGQESLLPKRESDARKAALSEEKKKMVEYAGGRWPEE
jgi:hypothetical protein